MLVTITEASRITGKARKTIYAHAKSGKVSLSKFNDGRTAIDTSELDRVYKIDLQKVLPEKQGKVTLGNSDSKLDLLLKKIGSLENEIKYLREEISSLKLIEYKPNEMPVKKTNEVSNLMAKLKSKL
ncbi:hypothetical protein ACT3RM_16750 [Pseudoalteromonas sp. AOP7-A1-14]|uniref:hypothetical protein n=1 Tax=Pseudoalteromonas sp. AOP7-A1-14 TaxID=3457648 RepID=UPI00402B3327